MSDNLRVQEVNTLLAVCFFGAFALFAILFIITLSINTRQTGLSDHTTGTATSTAR